MLKKAVLLSAFAFAACSGANEAAKDTLIVGVPMEAVSLDPFMSRDNPSSFVRANIFDRLIERGEDGNFVPSLASEWKYLNPVTFEVKLRQGVKFHNGEPFTAKDVKYSFERLKKSPDMLNIGAPIKAVNIIDDYTAQIILNQPFAPFEAYLTHVSVAMMNEKAVTEAGDKVSQQPVGTGPYKFSAWNRGQNVILEKNPDYWGDPVKLSKVEFRIIPEGSARTIALETGEVDVIYGVDTTDRDRIKGNSKFQIMEKNTPRTDFLGFNLGKNGNPLWKDARIRQAAAMAIDVNGIIQSVMFGAASPAGSILEASVFGATNLAPIARDLEKAKQLVAEAGIPKDAKVTLWTPSGYRQKIMEIIQANLKEIGIESGIEVLEWGRYIGDTAAGKQDVYILGWSTVSLDADEGLYDILHTKAFGSPGNRAFYSNPQVDALLAQARIEQNKAKRLALYQEVQVIEQQDVPMIPLFYPYETVAMKKSVKDFGFNLVSIHRLGKTYKE